MTVDKEIKGFLFGFVLAVLVGIASTVHGVRALITGSLTDTWLIDDVVARSVTFTGAPARWLGMAEIAFGVSLPTLAFILPRAIDARRTKGSLFALPACVASLLVAAAVILGVSTAIIASTLFWPASA